MSANTQVRLRLTEDKEKLSALRRNGAMRNAGTPDEFFAAQYNSFEYRFYHGKDMIVPQPVAEGLYKASGILIGGADAISDSQVPCLDVVEKWELGQQAPSQLNSKTTCPICSVDQGSVSKLVSHMSSHEEEAAEEEK